jgi:hypothetical protein
VTKLVQQNAEKESHHYADRDERREQTSRVLKTEKGEEGQEQEESPMHLYIYPEGPAYLKRATHILKFTLPLRP